MRVGNILISISSVFLDHPCSSFVQFSRTVVVDHSPSELERRWRERSGDATPNQCHIEMNIIIQTNQITMMHSLPILSI